MCIGIAIVGVVPPDGGPIQFYGKNGNSSHDIVLMENVVDIELHNRSFKIEYIFPNIIKLDAPDEVCRKQAVELGIADTTLGIARLKPALLELVANWIVQNNIEHNLKTLQEADLEGANLEGVNTVEYADDLTILAASQNTVDCLDDVQKYLRTLEDYFDKKKLKISAGKSSVTHDMHT